MAVIKCLFSFHPQKYRLLYVYNQRLVKHFKYKV